MSLKKYSCLVVLLFSLQERAGHSIFWGEKEVNFSYKILFEVVSVDSAISSMRIGSEVNIDLRLILLTAPLYPRRFPARSFSRWGLAALFPGGTLSRCT